jgi:NADPH-dependent 2,4-dienoyl-CoA reductase/sulfur reductase-like enzyme
MALAPPLIIERGQIDRSCTRCAARSSAPPDRARRPARARQPGPRPSFAATFAAMDLLGIDRELARDSYYAATAPRAHGHAPLQGAHECDVAVVGGGLAGLSAALELAERGLTR